ncbi:MAG: FliM/FliN family flagellar motor switch protein [Phycisphaerales bacterium]|nr:FliM/FliN family flagellar motor switch protein [Phycisphaerales bacterium]
MPADLSAILQLEVPLIVQIAERAMALEAVIHLAPGAIIELPKDADAELEVLVNNRVIGFGRAVKVGENFGVQISYVGDLRDRVAAMGDQAQESVDPNDPVAIAAQLLAGM